LSWHDRDKQEIILLSIPIKSRKHEHPLEYSVSNMLCTKRTRDSTDEK